MFQILPEQNQIYDFFWSTKLFAWAQGLHFHIENSVFCSFCYFSVILHSFNLQQVFNNCMQYILKIYDCRIYLDTIFQIACSRNCNCIHVFPSFSGWVSATCQSDHFSIYSMSLPGKCPRFFYIAHLRVWLMLIYDRHIAFFLWSGIDHMPQQSQHCFTKAVLRLLNRSVTCIK